MTWAIVFDKKAQKDLAKLERMIQHKIILELGNISALDNPRKIGKTLAGKFAGLWRYRVGDYRVVCQIIDKKIQILVIKIAHRKEIYK